ncbi:hypothetical protein BKA63DRAFT_490080 [Paraphoma chrysanthemicola]|nr:hypothetical protein BKA63DRAFT_490080 [Paraphoma chrysanthemicola]
MRHKACSEVHGIALTLYAAETRTRPGQSQWAKAAQTYARAGRETQRGAKQRVVISNSGRATFGLLRSGRDLCEVLRAAAGKRLKASAETGVELRTAVAGNLRCAALHPFNVRGVQRVRHVGHCVRTTIPPRGPIMGRSHNEATGGRNSHHHVGYAPGISGAPWWCWGRTAARCGLVSEQLPHARRLEAASEREGKGDHVNILGLTAGRGTSSSPGAAHRLPSQLTSDCEHKMKSNRILGHSSGHSAARWRDAQARPRCALCRLACSQKSAGSASASGGGDWTPLPQRDVLRQLISSARPSFLLVQSSFIPSISQSSASPRPLQLARRLPKNHESCTTALVVTGTSTSHGYFWGRFHTACSPPKPGTARYFARARETAPACPPQINASREPHHLQIS